MKTGRNDPCPCGSGKKYKQCCLLSNTEPGADDLMWRRVRRALEPLPKLLSREAAERFGAIGLHEARAEFFLLDDDEEWQGDDRDWIPAIMSHYFFDWLPDAPDTEIPEELHDETVAQALLRSAGSRLDPIARRYLESCSAAAASFYDILDVTPGKGFRARDLVRETEADVLESTASRSLKRGDTVFARVVPIEGLNIIESLGPIAIPPGEKPRLLEALHKLLPPRRRKIDALREYDYELREIYLALAEDLMDPPSPELRNTDGDPLEAHTLHFDLDAPEAAVKALADLGAGITEPNIVRDKNGKLLLAELTWSRAGNASHSDWDNTSLGFIRIAKNRLTAEVNSQRRAAALRALIEKKLGASARARPSVVQSTQSMLREERPAATETVEMTPEIAELITERLRAHYRKWIDDSIPALGGKTPRQSVRTKRGRESVAALIDQIERDGEHMSPPLDPSIVRELRTALKLQE